jgi:hypothetical protein
MRHQRRAPGKLQAANPYWGVKRPTVKSGGADEGMKNADIR